MLNIWNLSIELYQELFRQCSLNSSFVFKPTLSESKMLIKFLTFMKNRYKKHELSVTLFIQYFEFQFSRYSGTYSAGYGKNKIMFSWIVGIKAITAWNDRNISKKWLVMLKLDNEVCLRLTKTFKDKYAARRQNKTIILFEQLSNVEENQKQVRYNKPEGLLWCYTVTTLYDSRSKWCRGCIHQGDCINRLKQDFPLLYKRRLEIQDAADN